MFSIFKKEFNTFFSSSIAYLVIGVYLFINGLYLWVFDNNLNLLNAGFADLNNYFFLAPWLFAFLIPAITMRSFADEYKNGTMEILRTKPISNWDIVFGKFLATVLLVIIALLPTLIYIYSIYALGDPVGNIDLGSILGSYLGLLFLIASFSAIGLFASTLSTNQIVAFIIGNLLIFTIFVGLETIGDTIGKTGYFLENISAFYHYDSFNKGVLDTRDLLYFASLTYLFLFLTKQKLKND